MAETAADVRRDIELTRERMSDTIAQLEHKMNLMQVVKDHPWPALGVAFAAGVILSGSRADVKAAAASVAATQGASSKVGAVLDDLVASLVVGVQDAFQHRVEGWVNELKSAIGAPSSNGASSSAQRPAAGASGASNAASSGGAPATPWPTPSSFGGHQPGLTGEATGSGLGNQIAGQEAKGGEVDRGPRRAD